MDNEACQNEDRQLWQESDENGHRSLHVTKGGGIGINVGGSVWVMPLAKWHKLAVDSEAKATPTYLEEHSKLWAEAVKLQQELYRKNQSLQCEVDRLSRDNALKAKGGDCPNRKLYTLGNCPFPKHDGEGCPPNTDSQCRITPATPEQKEK